MRFITTLFLIFIGSYSHSQESPLSNPGLTVEIDEHNQAYYVHSLKKNETLYSLARYFKVPLEDLLIINDYRKEDTVPVGASIIIPINVEEIRTPQTTQSDRWVPLYYSVKSKETLYKISRIYFPQKIENLITRNNVSSFALGRGTKLLIGWWGDENKIKTTDVASQIKNKIKLKLEQRRKDQLQANSTQPEVITTDSELEMQLDSIISEIVEDETNEESQDSALVEPAPSDINYQPGVASWDKSGADRKNLFVMHNLAKPNSVIRLRYPVTGKEITAKVLCPIPENVFGKDIDIVISPAVAIALGALDSRFQIQMDYYK